jgi:xanthine dehydrogenase large subunit
MNASLPRRRAGRPRLRRTPSARKRPRPRGRACAPYVDDVLEPKRHAARRARAVARGARPPARRRRGARARAHARRARRGAGPPTFPATRSAGHAFAHDEPILADGRTCTTPGRSSPWWWPTRYCRHAAPRGAAGACWTSSRCPPSSPSNEAHGRAEFRAAARHRARGAMPKAPRWQAAPHRLRGTLRRRRPGAFLPRRPGCPTPCRCEQGQWHVLSQHPAPRRGAALGGARAGHRQPCRARGMPAHGRRLRWQGNAGRPPGRVGRAGRAPRPARPVKLRLDRDDDFLVTGKRHPFAYELRGGLRRQPAASSA